MIYLIAYTTILSVRSIFVEPFYLRTPYCLVALHILWLLSKVDIWAYH